ncbi:MAG: hypothetical protein K0Q68_1955 [Moraxellaceae bacterium]|nr:hypothetical protein [Moraxellaceae bacterium]
MGDYVAIETEQQAADFAESGKDAPPDSPSIEWSEPDLRRYLAKIWRQSDPLHIKIIGRLQRVEGKNFGILVDLHHAETGDKLVHPLENSGRRCSAFVPPSELVRPQSLWGSETFFTAELDFSPLSERKKKGDPFACMVRAGTLEPLSHIPDDWWKVQNIQSEKLPLILEKVRDAILDKVRRDTSDAKDDLIAAKRAVDLAKQEKTALEEEYERTNSEIDQQRDRIAALEAEYLERSTALESGFRELEAFLKEKGDRMVALRLIDRADLAKVFPPLEKADVRSGHRFQEALDGSLQRLASYIQAHLWRKGIRYTKAQLLNFITLLGTNDLIVLAGDSGSGKTSLVKSVASAIGGRCAVVPVKPNWTGSEDLLGYYNPIERRYHPSQFLLALLEASREPEIPHFICLDEMNLARVEYYFADFLSLLESRGDAPWIHLYSASEESQAVVENGIFLMLEEEARKRTGLSDDASFTDILKNDESNRELRSLAGFQEADSLLNHHAKLRRSLSGLLDIPSGFRFPSNVWIIGAINVDETTHYLSPKVLDRAHVMRFRNPVLVDWDAVEEEVEDFELDLELPMNMRPAEVGVRAEYPIFDQGDPRVRLLVDLARNHLDPLGIEFGLRAIRQSLNYILKGEKAGFSEAVALNNVAVQKILPKIILDVEKTTSRGEKRRDVLIGLRDALALALADLDAGKVTESAVDSLDELIARAEGNNGIANFWAR